MIVFDLQALQSAAHGGRGIGRYVTNLAATLDAEHPSVVDAFVWNDRLPYVDELDTLALGDRLVAASELDGRSVDLVHVNSPFEMLPYDDVVVPVTAAHTVVTCYDLIPYRFPDVYLTDDRAAAKYRTRLGLLASADLVVTDSISAAEDVIELVGVARRRVTTIGAGASAEFRPSDRPRAQVLQELRRTLPALAERFVLVPAGMDWRKNLEGALRAFAGLAPAARESVQLVLSCAVTDGYRRWIESCADDLGVGAAVVCTGHVPDEALVQLYQTADLVFFPSFYEGFGLPVIEARQCGARVICSGVSSLPEVLPDPVAHFDPWSLDSMIEALDQGLNDEVFRARLDSVRDPQMTWSKTARLLVDAYRHVLRDGVTR